MGNTLVRSPSDEEKIKKQHGGKKSNGKRKKPCCSKNSAPKKAKLETTKYVYNKLFIEGEDSDIIVCALGHQWNLHKFYLKQCKYFDVLLSGDWKDSKEHIFELYVPDEMVTVEGLHAVLGSLYDNEIGLEVEQLEGIIAASSLLELNTVLSRCSEAVIAALSDQNILKFLSCAHRYGMEMARAKAFEYLRLNFWRLAKDIDFLSTVHEEVMHSLMAAPDLLVCEGESDLYKILKTWIHLRLIPTASMSTEIDNANKSFYDDVKRRYTETPSVSSAASSPVSFTSSTEYEKIDLTKPYSIFVKYSSLFAGLRLHAILNTTYGINMLREDGIIPSSIINSVITDQYCTMLVTEEARMNNGDKSADDASDEAFLLSATRLGRSLDATAKCWRWPGFHYGVDLLININNGIISLKRNMSLTQPSTYSLNQRERLNVNYRFFIVGQNGQTIFDSQRKSVSIAQDVGVTIGRFATGELSPPYYVHLFVLFGKPPQPSFVHVNNYLSEMSSSEDTVVANRNTSVLYELPEDEGSTDQSDEEEEEETDDEYRDTTESPSP